jgi:hypothetical protein
MLQDNDLIKVLDNPLQPAAVAPISFAPSIPEMSDEEIYKRKIGVVEAEIEDNCIEHGIRGILKHGDIMNMISEYSEEDKQARVHGRFQHLTGLVLKKMSRQIHVIRPFQIRPQDFCVIELLDCHPRNPDAVMWVAFNEKGEKYVVDELYENFANVDDMEYKIKRKADQYRVLQRRADPSAWIEDQHTRVSLAKMLAERGLHYIPASKERTQGITLINYALDYEIKNIEGQELLVKKPMLYFFESAVRTIWEAEHWQYNEWTGKAAEKRNQSEKPMDKDDHQMENLGRALLDEVPFVQMPTKQNNQVLGTMPTIDPFD